MSVRTDRRAQNILVVEDNPADVRLLEEAFHEVGVFASMQVATDGQEAIEYLMQSRARADVPTPALILLDLNLPRKSGHKVLAAVKRDEVLSRIPVIVFSSSVAEADVRTAYDLQANSYIQKPTSLDSFFNVVRHIQAVWLRRVVLPAAA